MISSKDNFASGFTHKKCIQIQNSPHVLWRDKKIEWTVPTRLMNLEMSMFKCNSEIGVENSISYLFPVILNRGLKHNPFGITKQLWYVEILFKSCFIACYSNAKWKYTKSALQLLVG